MDSILIVKTSAIGDVIQTFPVLEYLRKRFPACQIDWVGEKAVYPLLSSHPQLTQALCIDAQSWRKAPLRKQTRHAFSSFRAQLQSKKYDLLFDLQGNTKSALVTWLAKAEVKVGFGFKTVPEKPNLLVTNHHLDPSQTAQISERYLQMVQRYFEDLSSFMPGGVRLALTLQEEERLAGLLKKVKNSAPLLMVAFGSKWRNKQLSPAVLLHFLQQVQKSVGCRFLFIYGNEAERIEASALQNHFLQTSIAVGELTLPLWQALMFEMEGVIAMDSAALHLCGTTSTPSFSIFGPSSANFYRPLGENHHAVQGQCPYGQTFEKRCPILRTCSTGSCIKDLPAEMLFEQFLRWWSGLQSRSLPTTFV